MTINITYIIVAFGIGLASLILEKVLKKGGGESSANKLGIISDLILWGIVLALIITITNQIKDVFLGGY